MSQQDPVAVVQQAYAAFGRGDIQGVINTLAEDIEWITPGSPDQIPMAGTRRGPAQVLQFFGSLAENVDFHKFDPYKIIAQGDTVVVMVRERSTIRPTGRTLEQELVHVMEVKNGRIARFTEYFDTAQTAAAFAPLAKSAQA